MAVDLGRISLGIVYEHISIFIQSYCPFQCLRVLVNRLGDLSLPRSSVVKLTDHPDMTI